MIGVWGSGDFLDRRAARLTLLDQDGRDVEHIARRTVLMATGMEHGMEDACVNPSDYSLAAVSLRYVNVGDTYDATLVRREPSGVWVWSSWGDELEKAETEYGSDTDQERCPHCGEWSGYVNRDTDRGECCDAVSPNGVDVDEIREGAATALFSSAYADECDRVSDDNDVEIHAMLIERFGVDYPTAGSGEDWLDVLPDVPASAQVSAQGLLYAVARENGWEKDGDTEPVLQRLCAEWQEEGSSGSRFGEASWVFGYALAMEALGTGVGLSDDLPADSRFAVKTPSWGWSMWE